MGAEKLQKRSGPAKNPVDGKEGLRGEEKKTDRSEGETGTLDLSLISAIAALPALPRSRRLHFPAASRAGFCGRWKLIRKL
jgi:hypothetical protein